MLTTLNLSLMNQLPQENGPFGEVSGDSIQALDGTTFAASLSVSFDDIAATGNPLPLAGIELPVDALPAAEPVGLPDSDLPILPIESIAEDVATMPVEWPPGLEPPVRAEEQTESRAIVVNADPLPARPVTETRTPIVPAEAMRESGLIRETAIAQAGADLMPRGALKSRSGEASAVAASLADVELTTDATDAESAELADLLRNAEVRGERAIPESPGSRTPVLSQDAFPSRAFDSNPQGQPSAVVADSAPVTGAASQGNIAQRAAASVNTSVLPSISTPVADPGWSDSIADRVLLMANNRLGNAEIRLTPAELGPVRVQVSIEDGTANVAFQATHAATREALEQALPRLRELFTDSGLSLSQASVSDQGVRDGGHEAAEDSQAVSDSGGDGDADLDTASDEPARASTVSNGLVDTFV